MPTDDSFTSRWNETVSQLYDFALTNPGKRRGGFIPVSSELATRVLTELGINISGYHFMMDADSIRHIHKQHGGGQETLRGQSPITEEDVLNMRLAMVAPDSMKLADPGRHELTRIEVIKEVSGFILFCIFEVRKGRGWIAPVTLYKRARTAGN